MELKYKIRRLIAAIILLVIFMTFTVSVLAKGIDAQIEQDRVMWDNHVKVHQIK